MWRRMCLCVLCVRERASQRPTPPPPLKLQLSIVLVVLAESSLVVRFCHETGTDVWTHEREIFSATAKILRNIECRTCMEHISLKKQTKKTDEVNSFLVPDH